MGQLVVCPVLGVTQDATDFTTDTPLTVYCTPGCTRVRRHNRCCLYTAAVVCPAGGRWTVGGGPCGGPPPCRSPPRDSPGVVEQISRNAQMAKKQKQHQDAKEKRLADNKKFAEKKDGKTHVFATL